MIFMDELIIDMTWFQVESLKLKVMEIRDSRFEWEGKKGRVVRYPPLLGLLPPGERRGNKYEIPISCIQKIRYSG